MEKCLRLESFKKRLVPREPKIRWQRFLRFALEKEMPQLGILLKSKCQKAEWQRLRKGLWQTKQACCFGCFLTARNQWAVSKVSVRGKRNYEGRWEINPVHSQSAVRSPLAALKENIQCLVFSLSFLGLCYTVRQARLLLCSLDNIPALGIWLGKYKHVEESDVDFMCGHNRFRRCVSSIACAQSQHQQHNCRNTTAETLPWVFLSLYLSFGFQAQSAQQGSQDG